MLKCTAKKHLHLFALSQTGPIGMLLLSHHTAEVTLTACAVLQLGCLSVLKAGNFPPSNALMLHFVEQRGDPCKQSSVSAFYLTPVHRLTFSSSLLRVSNALKW